MKKLVNIIFLTFVFVLLFLNFTNSSFAACQAPDMTEYNDCLSDCDDVSDLIQKTNCSNTCIGNWSKSKQNYNKCVTGGLGEQQTEKLSTTLVLPIILLIIAVSVGTTVFIIKKRNK